MKKSESAKTLIATYPNEDFGSDSMRGWKRSLTLYCRRKSLETGKPEFRFRAAIKAALNKLGYYTVEL